MTSVVTRARIIFGRDLVKASGEGSVRSKIVLASETSYPRAIGLPTHPIRYPFTVVIAKGILRLFKKIVVWVFACTAGITH